MRDSNGNHHEKGSLSSELAYLAARYIAEDGTINFDKAKQKAARQMSVADRGLLPNNREIDAALRLHQSLFQSNSQPTECRVLRRLAADAMQWLARFSPWLVGPVASGTASRLSKIELEIVADSTKPLDVFFLNERVPFDTKVKDSLRTKAGHSRADIVIYEITFSETPVVITCYSRQAQRFSHHPRESLKYARMQHPELELLLAR